MIFVIRIGSEPRNRKVKHVRDNVYKSISWRRQVTKLVDSENEWTNERAICETRDRARRRIINLQYLKCNVISGVGL